MQRDSVVVSQRAESVLATNKVLRNTYMLLAATILFSALMAGVAMAINAPFMGLWTLAIYIGLLFVTHRTANSAWGIVSVFALTGFLGFTLGPILNAYLSLSNGAALVTQALGLTAFVFFGLSGYVLATGKSFTGLGNFLAAGSLVLIGAIVISIFWPSPALSLALSAAFVLFSSMLILYQTGEIINGGETNYILATVTLYVSIYNLFLSLLQLLGFASDD